MPMDDQSRRRQAFADFLLLTGFAAAVFGVFSLWGIGAACVAGGPVLMLGGLALGKASR